LHNPTPHPSPRAGRGRGGVSFEMIIYISNLKIFKTKFEVHKLFWTAMIKRKKKNLLTISLVFIFE